MKYQSENETNKIQSNKSNINNEKVRAFKMKMKMEMERKEVKMKMIL